MKYAHRFTFISGTCSNGSIANKKYFSVPSTKAWSAIRNSYTLYLYSRFQRNIEKSIIKKRNQFSDKILRK